VLPSPFLAKGLKTLRAEAGWSQTELAEKIDSDGRQVSRYENGRITPSLEALVRIAETSTMYRYGYGSRVHWWSQENNGSGFHNHYLSGCAPQDGSVEPSTSSRPTTAVHGS
jgi:transcriptional regulator with XRE-family HTH domain